MYSSSVVSEFVAYNKEAMASQSLNFANLNEISDGSASLLCFGLNVAYCKMLTPHHPVSYQSAVDTWLGNQQGLEVVVRNRLAV